MKKFVPAFFIVLMSGLIGAKFALAEAPAAEAAQHVVTYDLHL